MPNSLAAAWCCVSASLTRRSARIVVRSGAVLLSSGSAIGAKGFFAFEVGFGGIALLVSSSQKQHLLQDVYNRRQRL